MPAKRLPTLTATACALVLMLSGSATGFEHDTPEMPETVRRAAPVGGAAMGLTGDSETHVLIPRVD